MIHLIGTQEVLNNTFALISPYFIDHRSKETTSIKNWTVAYHRYLKKFQPTIPNPLDNIDMHSHSNPLEILLNAFNEKSVLSDIEFSLQTANAKDISIMASKFTKQLSELKNSNEDISSLISFFIHTIFFAYSKQASGGTTSSAVGVLWANPREFWKDEDYIEFIIHELTHTLVFLDEHRFKHYNNLELNVDPENFAFSAVLGKKRPLDKVLHSLIVATEVLLFRDLRNAHDAARTLHPPTKILLGQSLTSINSLKNLQKPHLMTARAHELVDLCEAQLTKIAQKTGLVPNA